MMIVELPDLDATQAFGISILPVRSVFTSVTPEPPPIVYV